MSSLRSDATLTKSEEEPVPAGAVAVDSTHSTKAERASSLAGVIIAGFALISDGLQASRASPREASADFRRTTS